MSTANSNTNTDTDANNHTESNNNNSNNNNNNNNNNALRSAVILTVPEDIRKATFRKLKAINQDISVFERHSKNQLKVSPGK